jgi:glutamate racemase
VLGVIRPTTEIIGRYTKSRNIGILATAGTVQSGSYLIEIEKFFPDIQVYQEACPMWVPIIENNEHLKPGADYFVQKHVHHMMSQNADIDTLLLACTHYPLLRDKIMQFLPARITLVSQGEIVALSLIDYLQRHPEMDKQCSKNGKRVFFTTDSTEDFDNHASIFFGEPVSSLKAEVGSLKPEG